MIDSIRHNGLRELWETGASKKLPKDQIARIEYRLAFLDSITQVPQDFGAVPGWKVHRLTGDMKEYWSLKVSGNYRIIFKWDGRNASDIDYVDYH